MRRIGKIFAVILLLAAVVCLFVACKGKGDDNHNGNNNDNIVLEELLGEYYAVSGTAENLLTVAEDGKFTFVYEGQTMSGDYTLSDNTLVFSVDGTRIATGTAESNAIMLQYDGATLKMFKKIDFTLTFDTGDGSAVAAQTVLNGKTPALPETPTREGYKFVAWYADENCTTVFDFAEPMTASKTAYALWSKMEYETEFEVCFDLNYDGAPTLDPVQTIGNRLFSLPTPVREGYLFGGWYVSQYDSAQKLSYIFDKGTTVVGKDTTLYAFWQAEDAEIQTPMITVSGANITWSRVEGAGVTYKVTIKAPNGDYIKNDEATSNPIVTGVITGGGDYEITVTAVRGEMSSSATIYYRLNPLESVSGLTIEGKVLHFDAVPRAEKYLITAICADSEHRTENIEVTELQYDFSDCAMGTDGITIRVTAVADGYANSLISEITVTGADLGLETYAVTLHKGDYGEMAETTATVTQGFRFVLPVPEIDSASPYQFVGWYADESFRTPLTDTSGNSLGVWNATGDTHEAYARWVGDIFNYNLITVGNVEAYEIAAGKNFDLLTSANIPSVYDGKPVARIQTDGFADQTAITKIYIPDTVLEIGDGAFNGCTKLAALHIYDAGNSADVYTSIDGVIFTIDRYTSALSLYRMPEGRVGQYVIPDNVVGISDKAFEDCNVTDVTISASVTNIGVEAFLNSELQRISFVPGTEPLTIADRAFMRTELTEIHLPARLTSIALKRLEICSVTSGWTTTIEPVTDLSRATDAFYGCTALNTITVDEGSQTYKAVDNVLFSADGKTLIYAPYTLSGVYVVPVNTQTIADGAFYGTAITEVTIANTVTHIGEGAFFAHPTLATVRFSESASVGAITIGRYAFGSSSTIRNALTEFIVNDNTKIQTVCDYAFYYSQNLKEIHVSQFTTHIGELAFAYCRGAKSVDFSVGNEIRETALEIGANAFKSVPVETLTLGSSLKEFPKNAFPEATSLKEICVADDHETLISRDGVLYSKVNGQPYALIMFPDAKGGAYVIPDGVVEIGDEAFKYKTKITSVSIPASVTKIGKSAFEQAGYQTVLTEIVFTGTPAPDAELTIGDRAFYNTELLSSITLPAHIKQIGKDAFYRLGARTSGVSIMLNEGLEHIEDSLLTGVAITSITIPSTVKTIGNSAFANITTLTTVTFAPGSQLVEIGEKAFYGCPIEHITIPASVEVIKPFAFGCGVSFADDENGGVTIQYRGTANGIKALTFEDGSRLKTISAFAFAGSQIQSIVIPKSVTFVGAYAFAGSNGSLNSVTFEDGRTEPLMLGTETNVTVAVGDGVFASNIEYAFAGYVFDQAQLTTIDVPANAEVDANALKNCGLTE